MLLLKYVIVCTSDFGSSSAKSIRLLFHPSMLKNKFLNTIPEDQSLKDTAIRYREFCFQATELASLCRAYDATQQLLKLLSFAEQEEVDWIYTKVAIKLSKFNVLILEHKSPPIL